MIEIFRYGLIMLFLFTYFTAVVGVMKWVYVPNGMPNFWVNVMYCYIAVLIYPFIRNGIVDIWKLFN